MSDRAEEVASERRVESRDVTGRRGGRRLVDGRVRRIAVTEVRRSLRRLLADPAALAALGLLAVGTAGTTAGLTAVAVLPERLLAGAFTAAGVEPTGRLVLARATLAAVWVGLTGAMVSRTASVTGRLDTPEAVLLALSPRRAVLGVVGAEWLRAAGVLGPAVALSAVVAGRLAGGVAALTVATTGTLLVASAVAAGYPLGLALKATVEAARRRGIGWARLALSVGLFAGTVAAGAAVTVGLPTVRPLGLGAALPPGGLADLALAPALEGASGPVPDPARALAGVAWATGALLAGPLAAGVLAERLWLVDPPRSATAEYPGGLARVPAPPGSLAVRAVVRTVWLRAARAPVKLVYTLYPIGGVIALWVDPAARESIVASLYVYVPLYAAWASGAGLALNPLGDEGAGLPTALLAVRGRAFVRGHLLAAALPGAVVGGLVAVVGTALGGLSPVAAPVGVVVAGALAGLAGAVAVAVGVALPGFDSVRVSSSRRIVVPSFAASVAYFLALAALSTPGTLALLAVADLPTLLPDAPAAVAGAVAVQVGIALLAGLFGARSAARRFDRFTV